MVTRSILVLLCVGSSMALTMTAQAEPEPATETLVEMPSSVEAPSSGAPKPFGDVRAINGAVLQTIAGMANLQQFANANNTSVVSGNSVNGETVTGQIAIDGQSFQNMQGLSIISANTGNNVSINAAMNVNVSIQQ